MAITNADLVPVIKRPTVGTMTNARHLFADFLPQIVERLPQHLKPSASNLVAMALTAIQRTPKLLDCTPVSVLQTLITCSELGLNLNPAMGEVYAVPYGKVCTPIIGYRGLMKLCEQATGVRIQAYVVYEREEFDCSLGTDPYIKHRLCLDADPGPKRCAYAVGHYPDGSSKFYVLTLREVTKVRNEALRKAGTRDTPWRGENEDAMWQKTAVRRLCKFLSMSPEVMRAIEIDEAGERSEPMPGLPNFMDGVPENEPDAEPEMDAEPLMVEPQPAPIPADDPAPDVWTACLLAAEELGHVGEARDAAIMEHLRDMQVASIEQATTEHLAVVAGTMKSQLIWKRQAEEKKRGKGKAMVPVETAADKKLF